MIRALRVFVAPHLILILFALAALSAAPGARAPEGARDAVATFAGTIAESECPHGDHSLMRMGPTDAECAVACVDAHGATYVLYDGKDVYALSDQRAPEKFAARRVTVTGTLDATTKTIQVESIALAK